MWGLLALFKDIFPKHEPVTGQTLNYTAVLQICQRLEFSLYLVKPHENQGLRGKSPNKEPLQNVASGKDFVES